MTPSVPAAIITGMMAKAVQAVGQVHGGIGRLTHDHEHREGDEETSPC